MRYSLLPLCFFLFALSSLNAQEVTPELLQTITEDDLKLGIYDAPIFQPGVSKSTVRKGESRAKDVALYFDPCTDPGMGRRDRFNSTYVRQFLAFHGLTEGEAVALLLATVSARKQLTDNDR